MREHLLCGTFRKDRHSPHAPAPLTSDGIARLAALRECYASTLQVIAKLRRYARRLPTAATLRELRQQTMLLIRLADALERAEQKVPPTDLSVPSDAFNEFDKCFPHADERTNQ